MPGLFRIWSMQMSETNETLASLRSSIEALHSFGVTLLALMEN